jgi:threonine/homoserine/homoserine lactone efflux protein
MQSMHLLRVFVTGMLVSFLGTLPLGTLNVSAMQISLSDGLTPAFLFAIGALVVEMVYVRISLVAMNWFRKQARWMRVMEWATLLIILALAMASFYAAASPTVQKNPVLSNSLPRFWLGVLMSAVNPVQIPFWFGWSAVLFNRGVLKPEESNFLAYIAGIGLGTLLGNSLFIFGGQVLVKHLSENTATVQAILGGIFLVTAIIQGWRMWRSANKAGNDR